MSRPTTWRENREDGPVIHLDGNSQDYTLCGYAFEGACDGIDEEGLTEVKRGKVSCPTCVRIWAYCRTIAPKYIGQVNDHQDD